MAFSTRTFWLMGGLLLAPLAASQAYAANIVVNGGFEAGDTGFTSGYTSKAFTAGNCTDPGVYTVGTNPNGCHPSWASFSAHGGEKMMIINGADVAGVNVWEEAGLPVTPNTNYEVAVWVASVYPTSPAQLQFSLDINQIGSVFTASSTVGDWQEFTAPWNSGANTTADFAIVNQNTAFNGNDFALDDISMSAVPEPGSLLVLGTGLLGLGLTVRRRNAAG